MAQDSISIVAATRPHPHETLCGDLWTVQWAADSSCRLAVIDGLGHGPVARAAEHGQAEPGDQQQAPERQQRGHLDAGGDPGARKLPVQADAAPFGGGVGVGLGRLGLPTAREPGTDCGGGGRCSHIRSIRAEEPSQSHL